MVTSTENHVTATELLRDRGELRAQVQLIVNSTYVTDVHTHIFPPEFKQLCLFGIDELLTYHYLVAETFRSARISYDRFWRMSKTEQADLVWQTLFVENSPLSEAAARKFSNLMPFGCWWFLNNPSIVSEITRQRFELLGPSFIPQHSDARVLEQLIYKWRHARKEIAGALCKSYEQLLDSGRAVTSEEISRDVRRMFSGNFND